MSVIQVKDMSKDSMIKISNAFVYDLDESVAASKYAMQTVVDPSKTDITETTKRLAQCTPGTGHDNWMCGIRVAFDISFTLKCLVEVERYHFMDIVTCNSTMHRIIKFDLDKAYCKYVDKRMIDIMKELVDDYNSNPSTESMLKILYSNPAGFTYTMRINTNYRQLKTIDIQRDGHLIPEWQEFRKWIEDLPHSYLIIGSDRTAH